MPRKLLLLIPIFFLSTANGQSLNWHLTAQAGTVNNHFKNFQGAFLAGFESMEGQHLSFGPVVKGYLVNTDFKNLAGGRIYSQSRVIKNLSLYIQCDIFNGVKSPLTHTRSPMRLESGAGVIYTIYEKIGLSAGYNFGEYNPLNSYRKNSPAIKLVYLVPLANNRGW